MNGTENEDPMEDFEDMTMQDAEKLREIILKNGSLWAIAVDSYNLGRQRSTPKS
jgi:hypothetical protein